MKGGKVGWLGETKSPKGEEDEKDVRQQIRDFIDSKWITILMTGITLWALFGDDIRMLATDRWVDTGFYASYVLCLALFAWELLTNCIVLDGYKYSFFFWLDLVATVSMILDVPYMINPYLYAFSYSLPTSNVTAETKVKSGQDASSYAQRILKSFRLIRLVRIVKLYKYFTKSNTEEEEQRLREAQRQAQNARQAAMNREMDPTRLGKQLSDLTTKRVIIGVLLLLFVLPNLQVQDTDTSKYYGLQQLFWMGRSACYRQSQFGCEVDRLKFWLSEDGWRDMVYRYSKSSESTDGGSLEQDLLWLRTPDFLQNGIIGDIQSIQNATNFTLWSEDSDCAGKTVSSSCRYRDSEMSLVVYHPDVCSNNTDPEYSACKELFTYARFGMKKHHQNEALLSILVTVFIGVILAVGSVTFTIDAQNIIIVPITKMVLVIKGLADDPLKKREKVIKSDNSQSEGGGPAEDQESMLKETVMKISSLLLLSFGEDGAQMISKNMSSEGELNLMRPGARVDIVMGFCSLCDTSAIVDALNEETMRFFNNIARIVHSCATHWDGFIAKNDLFGSFLVVWKLPELGEKENTTQDSENNPAVRRTDLVNRALIAFVKIIAEMGRCPNIAAFQNNAKIVGKFGTTFAPKLQCGLHLGWAIEGIIGSDLKIDPAYLSSDVALTQALAAANQYYGTSLLMTENLYGVLSVKAKSKCRRIDNVFVEVQKDTFGVYTFDVAGKGEEMPEVHEVGSLIKLAELASVNIETFQHQGVDYMFTLDSDLVLMQRGYTPSFYGDFRTAYAAYVNGDWQDSLQALDACLIQRAGDGPALSLKAFLEESKGKSPEDWPGCRSLPSF